MYDRIRGDPAPQREQPYKAPGWKDLRLRQRGDFRMEEATREGYWQLRRPVSHPASLCTCSKRGHKSPEWYVSVGEMGRPVE